MNTYIKVLERYAQRLLATVMFLSCWASGFGQNYIDLLRIEYSGSPGNDFKTESGSSDIRQWAADLTIPVVLSPRNALLTGFLYEHTQARLYPDQGDVTVSTLNFKLGLSQTYSDTWSASYLLLPKFASDLKQYKKADFQMGVAVLLKYTKSKNLQYKFGAYYNTERFGPFITPFLGMYYRQAKWELNVLLPRVVDLNYRLTRALRLGMRFDGSIKSYQLNDDRNGTPQYLSVSNNEIGAYLGWAIGRIHIIGSMGYSIGRNYRTYAQGDRIDLGISLLKLGDNRTQLNPDVQDGPVFKVSALYRLYPDKEDPDAQ